jgi:hypothetical protein
VSDFDAGGVLPPAISDCRVHGRCPLDGYHLVEFDEVTVYVDGAPVNVEGGWEHVLPFRSPEEFAVARLRIAEAHAFEVLAAAEQITRQAGGSP